MLPYSEDKGIGAEYLLIGTVGLTLPRRVRHVYGYKVVAQAISGARRNARLNGIRNATFVEGDLNKIGENFGKTKSLE